MANLNLSEFTEKLFVADADHTFIWDSAMSISKRVSRNSWLNSGTLTSDAPVTISQTWNGTGSTVFTALKVNATSTNSASGSLLLDLQLGGVSKFSVEKSVNVIFRNNTILFEAFGANTSGLQCVAQENFTFRRGEFGTNRVLFNALGVYVTNASVFGFSSTGDATGAADTILLRDGAANTLALRNGAAAQTFNVYGTYTSGTVYERMFMRYTAASTLAFQIGTEQVGATARPLQFSISGSKRLIFEATGVNDTQIYAAGNTARNILTLRSSDESGRYQFYINAAGKSELYVGTGVLISEAGSSYFNGGNVGIGTTSPTSKLQVSAGDVEVDTIAKGVILKSPDGTRYRVTVANGGTLSVAAV